MQAKKLEKNKIAIQLENGDYIILRDQPEFKKIIVEYDTGQGPKVFFEFDYKQFKLGELQTFG